MKGLIILSADPSSHINSQGIAHSPFYQVQLFRNELVQLSFNFLEY